MKLRLYAFLITILVGISTFAHAEAAKQIDVFKNQYCGCCHKWVEHLSQNGFKVVTHDMDDVSAKRKALGMSDRLGSCHSAKVGNYVIEGHVPAQDIKRLLAEKPKALGLAVPAMPQSAPGMDIPGTPYDTLLVRADGTTSVFAHH